MKDGHTHKTKGSKSSKSSERRTGNHREGKTNSCLTDLKRQRDELKSQIVDIEVKEATGRRIDIEERSRVISELERIENEIKRHRKRKSPL